MSAIAEAPEVKVVLTTFRRARFLTEALDSVFVQNDVSLHVVIVDDNSDDDTRDVLSVAVARYPGQVTLINKTSNRGPADSVKIGIEAGPMAPYVAFLNDDDRWLSNKLSLQLQMFAGDPRISGCFTEAFVIDDNGSRTGAVYSDHLGPFVSCELDQVFDADPVCVSTLMLRADVARRAAATMPDPALAHDFYTVLVGASMGKFASIATPLAEYRLSVTNIHSRVEEMTRSTTEVRAAAVNYVPEVVVHLGGPRVARRRLALVTLKEAMRRLEARHWREYLWQSAVVVRQLQMRPIVWLVIHSVMTLRGQGPMRRVEGLD